jgi:hypothetical protein
MNPEYDIVLPYKGGLCTMCVGTIASKKGLEIAATSKTAKKGGAWLVSSQSGKGRYTVCLDPIQTHCSCPDHEEGGFKCKHIFAVEYVIQRESHSDGSTTVTETLTVRTTRKTYPQDWRAYSGADRRERAVSRLAATKEWPAAAANHALFAAVEIRDRLSSDTKMLPALVDSTARNFKLREVSADKIYASLNNYRAIERHGAVPYIVFKSNHTGSGRGREHGSGGGLWAKMFHYFQYRREEFLRHYHKRAAMLNPSFRDQGQVPRSRP